MAKVTFILDIHDDLVKGLKDHWNEGGQIILAPCEWESFKELPPIAMGHNDYESDVELTIE